MYGEKKIQLLKNSFIKVIFYFNRSYFTCLRTSVIITNLDFVDNCKTY